MNHRRRNFRISTVALAMCLFLGACGSDSEVTSAGSSIGPISEQDLEQARLRFDAAKAVWSGREPAGHVYRAGVETINMIEIEFDADGNAGEEVVLFGDANPEGWAYVPRSVAEAFDEVESLLVGFESGEFEVPGPDDCGYHFNAEFDPELGAPTYFDGLGPCDDGVGIRIEVIPFGASDDGPVIPAASCSDVDYYGTWRSARAAGDEPPDPDDGVGDEGGVGVVILTLADGGSTLQSQDTIEMIDEWFCADGQLYAISTDGEELPIATISGDGTLTARGEVLSRDE